MLSSPKLPLNSSIGAAIVLPNGDPTLNRYFDGESEAMQRYRRMLGETLPDGDGRCRKRFGLWTSATTSPSLSDVFTE
jgi:hypothetical protein